MTRDEIRRMLPLQAGALLGPLTGTGVVTLGPVPSDLYGVPIGAVGLTITAYMVPFALVQLFSGSISQIIHAPRPWLKAVPQISEDRVGIVLAVAGAVGIPASAVAGGWVDRFGRRAVGIAGLAGYVTALLALATLPYSFWGTVVLAAWFGWTAAVAWAALNTLAVEIDPALRKPVASVYNAFRFLGYSLAPPVLGLVYGQANVAGVLLASALVVALSAALVAALRLPRRNFP